jgi:hypothetical protein
LTGLGASGVVPLALVLIGICSHTGNADGL